MSKRHQLADNVQSCAQIMPMNADHTSIAHGICILHWIHANNRRAAEMVNERCSWRCRLNSFRLKHGLVRYGLCKQTPCQLTKKNVSRRSRAERKKQTEIISD